MIKTNSCNSKYLDPEGLQYLYLKLLNQFNNLINNYDISIIEKYGIKSGPTISRPKSDLKIGLPYFDTDLNKPIWWNGIKWVDNNGDDADLPHKGNSDIQPNANEVSVGYTYFNTDDNILYVSNGTTWEIVNCCGSIDDFVIWANLSGTVVSYDFYDYIGWSNTSDDSYTEVDDIEYWNNI